MSSVSIGICDENRIFLAGMASLLANTEGVKVELLCPNQSTLLEMLKAMPVNVLIINMHSVDGPVVDLLKKIQQSYPKVKTLVVSVHNTEEMVLKTIKAGANGFLANDAEKDDLLEAIYTIRNGFDYFSKSIAHILVNRYVDGIKNDDKSLRPNMQNLSARQIEILKLWGANYSNKEIAEKLFISLRTVETHKNHIMQKFNLKTTVDMVKFGIRNKLIDI
jgi:DNA-binding NarL/FixJ family response regulator